MWRMPRNQWEKDRNDKAAWGCDCLLYGWQKDYIGGIATNRLATITKVLDRCHNISTMATGFTKEKMAEYIMTTEEYVLPLLNIMKNDYDETCYNAAFLIKYQMLSILESLKRLL